MLDYIDEENEALKLLLVFCTVHLVLHLDLRDIMSSSAICIVISHTISVAQRGN